MRCTLFDVPVPREIIQGLSILFFQESAAGAARGSLMPVLPNEDGSGC